MSLLYPYDELTLLAEVADGNQLAFRRLFDNYKDRFYSVVFKMTGLHEVAEDITQETFISIWKNREQLKEVRNPSSYFFTIVYRRVYRYYYRTALERKSLKALIPKSLSVNNTEETIYWNECNEVISSAVAKLPPQQKQIFILSKKDGLSREDIANRMKISPNTVRNHLSAAMKFVKSFWDEYFLIIIFFIIQKIICS